MPSLCYHHQKDSKQLPRQTSYVDCSMMNPAPPYFKKMSWRMVLHRCRASWPSPSKVGGKSQAWA